MYFGGLRTTSGPNLYALYNNRNNAKIINNYIIMLKYIIYAVYLYIINVQKVEDKYTFHTFNNKGKSIK